MTVAIPTGVGAPQGLKYYSTTLTQAQIAAMSATPIQLIAAQGAGTVIWPTMWSMNYIAATGAGAVAFSGGGIISLQWGNTALAGGPFPLNTSVTASFLTSGTTNEVAIRGCQGGPTPQATTNCANTGLYITNGTGAFSGGTGGTTNATVAVQILYWVFSGFV